MKFLQSLIFLFFILLTANLRAQQVQLSDKSNRLKIVDQHIDYLTVSFILGEFYIESYKAKYENYFSLKIPGFSRSFEPGHPRLPVKTKLIELPLGAKPKVVITDTNASIHHVAAWGISNQLIPVQASVAKNAGPKPVFKMKNQIYDSNVFYNKPMVQVEMLGIMRDKRLARITISPFQYNPVQNTFRVYEQINFKILYAHANHQHTLKHKQRYHHPYSKANTDRLLNASPYDTITQYPIKYIIVSDPMFEEMLQAFIHWKTRKGFNVIDVYTDNPAVGTTPESIKAFLQGQYLESEQPQSFILLVGDDEQIPSFTAGSNDHYADFYFGEYTGDLLPDAFVGRFSARNPGQLQPQIDKTLQYEQYTFPDPSFLNETVMIAGMDSQYGPIHGNGQMNYATDYYFNEGHNITSYTYLYPESGQSEEEIIFHVSQGVGFVNYTAHGNSLGWTDPSFSVQDIDGLNNTDEYPLMIGNGCSTNEFSIDSCFGEALLRAENKGALGYIGGTNDTYWDEDYYWSVGMASEITANPTYEETGLGAYDRWFHDHGEPQSEWYSTMAQMQVAGNLAVTESGSYLEQYYWEVYHLMGDPSLMIHFSQPVTLEISHDSIIPIGLDHFTVNTEPYTYVALSANGELHGAALSGSDGLAEIDISPFLSYTDVELIATNQNRQPYIDTLIAVTPDGPYVIYDDLNLNDETGNNNQKADYGESITLDVTFSNVGNEASINASAEISTPDEYITLIDSMENNIDVPAGETLVIENAFHLTISDSIPDEHTVFFDMTVSQNDTAWNSTFSFSLHAPIPEIAAIIIDDQLNGNDNGRLDAGEEVQIRVSNKNTGSSNAINAQALLECASPYITISNKVVSLGVIAPQVSKYASFMVEADEDVPLGTDIPFIHTLQALPYRDTKDQIEIIGVLDEDFETGDLSKYDWNANEDSAWTITSKYVYEGDHSARSDTIGHGHTSTLSLDIEVLDEGPLSFFRKVSSEEEYDMLRFYVDDELMDEWSGEKNWELFTYQLSKGDHTLRWAYEKDATISANNDAAFLDYIVFPPMKNSLNVEEIQPDSLNFRIFPNPVVRQLSFNLQMPARGYVTLEIYNLQGIKLKTILNQVSILRRNENMDISYLSTGTYLVVLKYGNERVVKKLVVTKP